MTPLRVALIGAGAFARRHLEALEAIGGVRAVGHLARRRASAQRLAERFGGESFDEIEPMLDATEPDAVWITVPPHAHGAPEAACTARGIPFFVEKPLSADRATAERIGAAVRATSLVTGVGYGWRALDALPELRERLADASVRLVRGAWHSSTPAPAWWRREATSGGQMVEQATHVIDLARHLVGEANVEAATDLVVDRPTHPDADVAVASTATLRYRSGALGLFSATCALGGPAEIELGLYAEGLHVVIDQQGVRYDDGRVRRVVRHVADPVVSEDRAFLQAVRASDPSRPYCSYDDALTTHALVHRITELARASRATA